MTTPLRERLAALPRHLLWQLADRFQRFQRETKPDDEYVKWADVEAALRAVPAGEDGPFVDENDKQQFLLHAEALRAAPAREDKKPPLVDPACPECCGRGSIAKPDGLYICMTCFNRIGCIIADRQRRPVAPEAP